MVSFEKSLPKLSENQKILKIGSTNFKLRQLKESPNHDYILYVLWVWSSAWCSGYVSVSLYRTKYRDRVQLGMHIACVLLLLLCVASLFYGKVRMVGSHDIRAVGSHVDSVYNYTLLKPCFASHH